MQFRSVRVWTKSLRLSRTSWPWRRTAASSSVRFRLPARVNRDVVALALWLSRSIARTMLISLRSVRTCTDTLNGDSNVHFFRQLWARGVRSAELYTVMSLSIAETEIAVIGAQYVKGHFAAW